MGYPKSLFHFNIFSLYHYFIIVANIILKQYLKAIIKGQIINILDDKKLRTIGFKPIKTLILLCRPKSYFKTVGEYLFKSLNQLLRQLRNNWSIHNLDFIKTANQNQPFLIKRLFIK